MHQRTGGDGNSRLIRLEVHAETFPGGSFNLEAASGEPARFIDFIPLLPPVSSAATSESSSRKSRACASRVRLSLWPAVPLILTEVWGVCANVFMRVASWLRPS